MDDSPWIRHGFVAAGAVNILGVMLFSKGLTNAYLSELDPQVFSPFGLKVILLWGMAYLAVAKIYRQAKWVVAVFAIEKLLYFAAWAIWMTAHHAQLPTIFEASPLTGTFFAFYGPSDLFFGLFFAWVFFKARKD